MNEINKTILSVLRNTDHYVSGQMLCEKLNVSRAAVSKHVQALRKLGYEIDSVPRRGHRLITSADSPLDIEVQQYLKTDIVGKHYTFVQEIPSTNSYLSSLPLSECHDGMVIAADSQTAGRGRMKRKWHSPKGANLYFSVLLQPKKDLSDIPQLALITAVSIVEALQIIAPEMEMGIKWPNDILIKNRKLAGILCEMQAEADAINKVILGIGINVNATAKDFPPDLREQSTSLRIETGNPFHRPPLMAELLNSLDRNYRLWTKEGLTPFLPLLKERLLLVGKKIKVKSLGNSTEGVVEGISDDGGLVLKVGNEKRILHSGEVHIGNI